MKHDERHGGPYDRGSADSYYRRGRNPHYYVGGTGTSEKIVDLTISDLDAYNAGYNDNEESRNFKDYGHE
jgi:hypothetical protein